MILRSVWWLGLIGSLVSAAGADLESALDGAGLTWSTGGGAVWVHQTSVTSDGVDAAQAGSVSDGNDSWVQTTVTGPGAICWDWKVNSLRNFEFLEVWVDGERKRRVSGNMDWHLAFELLDSGPHSVRWRLTSDDILGLGTSQAWLDRVAFTPASELGEATDAPTLSWSSIGHAHWFNQSTQSFDGVDAAQSGAITHNQASSLLTAVSGSGRLTWRWKVSSEDGFDGLLFLADGTVRTTITGERDWQSAQVDFVTDATHSCEWQYSKDESVSHGLDAGWVDAVVFTPMLFPPSITTQPSRSVSPSADAILAVGLTGTPPLSIQWLHNGSPVSGATNATLTLVTLSAANVGDYTVMVTNSAGSITSQAVNVPLPAGNNIGDAVEAPQLIWSTGGDADWSAQISVTSDGEDALASGDIGNSQFTQVQTTVPGPGRLIWSWKVSSEADKDVLELLIDNVFQGTCISGEVDWHRRTNWIRGAGSHQLRWRYRKSATGAAGQDKAWLDQVIFEPGTPPLDPELSGLPRPDMPVVNAPVHAILETNGVIYLGGEFTAIGPNRGRGGAFDLYTGDRDPLWPEVQGGFASAVEDGDGGFIIAGNFTAVNGQARTNVARLLRDRTLDPNWNVSATGAPANVGVVARRGDVLYIGGEFSAVNGVARMNVAAVNAKTGALLPFNPGADDKVNAIWPTDDAVYLGGQFQHVQGTARGGLAAVDASGQLLAWDAALILLNPESSSANPISGRTNLTVHTLHANGKRLYVGGAFDEAQGVARLNLAAFDLADGALLAWAPNPNGKVFDVAADCDDVYVVGPFTSIAGAARQFAASVSANDGTALAFNPSPNITPLAVAVAGSQVILGGGFATINDIPHRNVAAIDRESGQPSDWSPQADAGVFVVLVSGDRVILSGIQPFGQVARSRLAALDARTGELLDWAPEVNGIVTALAFGHGIVYVGGAFNVAENATRKNLAAFDANSGELWPWAPTVDVGRTPPVFSLAVLGDRIFVGGDFDQVNAAVGIHLNQGLVAFGTNSAVVWAPIATDFTGDSSTVVNSMWVDCNILYVAGRGEFPGTSINRTNAAAYDITEAIPSLLSWNPSVEGTVRVVVPHADRVYLGGDFQSVAGTDRPYLAAVRRFDGSLLGWNPMVNGLVNGIVPRNDLVYLGGGFDSVGPFAVNGLAGVTSEQAGLGSWRPLVTGLSVNKLVGGSQGAMHVAGNFAAIDNAIQPFFANFPLVGFPNISSHPVGVRRRSGESATFSVQTAFTAGPITYQWRHEGNLLTGETNATLTLASVTSSDVGDYDVKISNPSGVVTSRPARLAILEPVMLTQSPVGGVFLSGNNIVLTAAATGSPAPRYQWLRNGERIPGAVLPTYTIPFADPADSGRYNVLIANSVNALKTPPIAVDVTTSALAVADNFADAPLLPSDTGVGEASNATANNELNEPRHAGKIGGRSVWVKWTAPAVGVFRMDTKGSEFDTLLAAYSNTPLSAVNEVVADDESAGFHNSEIAFNTVAGETYHIAIDGFFGASGRIVLNWSHQTTPSLLPVIVTHPADRSVAPGGDTLFEIQTAPLPEFFVQWEFNCQDLPGETNLILSLTNAQPVHVGQYLARLTSRMDSTRVVKSRPANLEISQDAKKRAFDRFRDAVEFANTRTGSGLRQPAAPIVVRAGTLDSQIFSNVHATTDLLEPVTEPVIFDASMWVPLEAESNGLLELNTIGSDINTTMTVYSGTVISQLTQIASDTDGAPDGVRSLLRFPAMAGSTYLAAVSGVNVDQGRIHLNHRTIQPGRVQPSADGSVATLESLRGNQHGDVTYQWRLNGANIDGATSPDYDIPNFGFGHAGSYSVIISNAIGVSTNHIVDLRLLMDLAISSEGNGFRLRLTNQVPFVLEGADRLFNPNWTPLRTNSASSQLDFTEMPTGNAKRYYRIVPLP